ncbi:MAG TPA: MgtC/SapB family protein [Ktedonobacterales bacterium]|jgi:putative Mg2+ transporter-C (MgtC) family protein
MFVEELIRLAVAAVLGAAIGLERERLERGAGLRTHALVATASALVMLVSSYGFAGVVTADHTIVVDPSRIAAQVVSGIGFLGAGTIILRRNAIRGLTTAASVWAVAGIGLAAGAGLYFPAGATTGILLVILTALRPVERRLFGHKRAWLFALRVRRQAGQVSAIEAEVRASGHELSRLALEPGRRDDEGAIRFELRGGVPANLPALAERLQRLPGVQSVTYSVGRLIEAEHESDADADDLAADLDERLRE